MLINELIVLSMGSCIFHCLPRWLPQMQKVITSPEKPETSKVIGFLGYASTWILEHDPLCWLLCGLCGAELVWPGGKALWG